MRDDNWQQRIISDYEIPASIVETLAKKEYAVDFALLYERLKLTKIFHNKLGRKSWPIWGFIAFAGSVEGIQHMIMHEHVNPKQTNNSGQTALHYAALGGNLELVDNLIEKHRMNPNQTDNFGSTALHCAVAGGHLALVAYLLEKHQMDPNQKDNDGWTALHSAVYRGHLALVDHLIEKQQMDPKNTTKNHSTLLHVAAWSGISDAIAHIISAYPYYSVGMWIKNSDGDTPDSYAAKGKSPKSATAIRNELLLKAAQALIANDRSNIKQTHSLLDAYQDIILELMTKEDDPEKQNIWEQLQNNKHWANLIGPEKHKSLRTRILINLKSKQVVDVQLTPQLMHEIVTLGEAAISEKAAQTALFHQNSSLLTNIKKLISHLRAHNLHDANELPEDVVRTLMVIIADYQRVGINSATREIDNGLVRCFEASKTLQLLLPQKKVTKGRDIQPNNFENHLNVCREALENLKNITDDTRRITNNVLAGIEHIMKNPEQIKKHVKENYGQLYDVAENLPLHTDHVEQGQPNAYYETLQRLITNFFGAFYQVQEAGQLNTFFDKVSSGYCFEGKVRDTFEWATLLSEIKTVHECMEKYWNDFIAYQWVMCGENKDSPKSLQAATEFISEHHPDMFCKPDKDYAPEGILTKAMIRKYLEDVLSLEPDSSKKEACVLQ